MKTQICVISYGQYLENLLKNLDFTEVDVKFLATVEDDFFQNITVDFKTSISQYNLKPKVILFEDLQQKLVLMEKIDCFVIAVSVTTAMTLGKILKKYGISSRKTIWCNIFADYQKLYKDYLIRVKATMQSKEKLDYLCTGISYTKYGFDEEEMHPYCGEVIAQVSQDLYYSYEMFKYIVQNSNHKFRFALIGLAPYQLDFSLTMTEYRDRQMFYYPIIGKFCDAYRQQEYIKKIFNNNYKEGYTNLECSIWKNMDEEGVADREIPCLNDGYPSITNMLNADIEGFTLGGKEYPETQTENLKILKQYIDFCHDHQIVPIGIVFPFSKALKKHYPKDRLQEFYAVLEALETSSDFITINLFELQMEYKYFFDTSHLNKKGAKFVSRIIRDEVDTILAVRS